MSPFNTAASVSSLISRFGGLASLSPLACLLFVLLLIAQVLPRLRPIARDSRRHCPCAWRGSRVALAVDALGIFAAGHFQALRGAGEFHSLVGDAGDILQNDRAATDEIGGAREDLQRRDPTCQRGAEAGILRPNGVLGPDIRRCWARWPRCRRSSPPRRGSDRRPRCECTSIRPGVTQWPLPSMIAGSWSAPAGLVRPTGSCHPRSARPRRRAACPCQSTRSRAG